MQFTVIEIFADATRSWSTGASARGRMMPEGLQFNHSWVAADMSRCFLIAESENASVLQQFAIEWLDLASFEIVPVATSKETVAGIDALL